VTRAERKTDSIQLAASVPSGAAQPNGNLNESKCPVHSRAGFSAGLSHLAQDPLPSWNDTAPKKAIIAFVTKVTKPGSPDFVPVPERIATFDNDGTLWAEQPIYFQYASRWIA
jgi:hypothetical protein